MKNFDTRVIYLNRGKSLSVTTVIFSPEGLSTLFTEHQPFVRVTVLSIMEVKKLAMMTSAFKQLIVYYTGENRCTQATIE